MKKLIALSLALVMILAMAACGKKNAEVPGSALEILENVWALYGDDEKFPVMGGDAVNMVDGAPGAFGIEDTDMLAIANYSRRRAGLSLLSPQTGNIP